MTKIKKKNCFEHLKIKILRIVSRFDIRISDLLFYLIILFLPTQFGRHFWPAFSNVLGVRIDYLSPTLYFTDVLTILFLFSFAISNFKKIKKSKIKKIIFPYWKLGIFIIFLLVGIFLSKIPILGFYGLVKFLEFFFFALCVSKILRKENFQIVLFVFCMSLVLESSIAIAQYLKQESIGGIFYFIGERTFTSQTPGISNASPDGKLVLRPYGTLPHPNVLAGYLVIVIIMLIYNLDRLKKDIVFSFKTSLFLISIAIGSVTLFLTMSRVAILLWILIVGMVFVKNLPKGHVEKFLVFAAALFLIICFLLFTPLRYRFLSQNILDESLIVRKDLLIESFSMVKKNPFVGIGLNNFLLNTSVFPSISSKVFYFQPVHNIYLFIAAETGVFGLSFFIWFLWKTYRQILNIKSKTKKKYIIYNSKFAVLSAILFLGLLDHYFLTLQQGRLIFSFAIGMIWARFSDTT